MTNAPHPDKRIDAAAFIDLVAGAASVAFGGGGLQRKPMRAVSAIARSPLEGLEGDHLSRRSRCRPARRTRQDPATELRLRRLRFAGARAAISRRARIRRHRGRRVPEALMLTALEAAAVRLPFLPSRFGLGTDVLTTRTCPMKTFNCPLTGKVLVAVPALAPGLAVIHANEADTQGNALIHGDPFADCLLAQAADRVVVTAERVVEKIPADHPRVRQ
ncbi:MAG: hypothetical protein M5U09_20375 [Gammaproteobacteria bacterium]|nr:hypothetical protein [Gammaproteobacteria bacterium]